MCELSRLGTTFSRAVEKKVRLDTGQEFFKLSLSSVGILQICLFSMLAKIWQASIDPKFLHTCGPDGTKHTSNCRCIQSLDMSILRYVRSCATDSGFAGDIGALEI